MDPEPPRSSEAARRAEIRRRLADGSLPREPPPLVQTTPGGGVRIRMAPAHGPCAACGEPEAEMGLGAVALHRRCYALWREEVAGGP